MPRLQLGLADGPMGGVALMCSYGVSFGRPFCAFVYWLCVVSKIISLRRLVISIDKIFARRIHLFRGQPFGISGKCTNANGLVSNGSVRDSYPSCSALKTSVQMVLHVVCRNLAGLCIFAVYVGFFLSGAIRHSAWFKWFK